jgi:hypothetical protein
MKQVFGLLLLMGLAGMSFAQHETFFSNTRLSGAFGAPIIEVGFNNDMATAVGGVEPLSLAIFS